CLLIFSFSLYFITILYFLFILFSLLLHIENLSEAVKANTSPAGAEKITKEMEELRQAWQRLRQVLLEIQEELQSSLDSESEYSNRCKELWVDLEQLRTLVQNLSSDLESRDGERTKEHMVAQWKTHTGVRNKLIAEEPRVEQLKSRLKELFRFPQDSKSLSDEMLAVVKEYQSVKGRSFRLSSESEMALRQILQDPLYGFSQWSQVVSQVLEASAEVTDFSQIALLLLKNSVQLQERLSLLQVKSDLLSSVFGQEKADDLLQELRGDVRKRELLHSNLLECKNHLQVSRQQQLKILLLYVQTENIAEHESFHDNILNMEKWLMIMRQKLESFRRSNGEWSINNRQALGEFPEKELQLHQTEAQGQTVLARTSDEGKVHIQQDLKRLRETWMSLHTLSLNLYRLEEVRLAEHNYDILSDLLNKPHRNCYNHKYNHVSSFLLQMGCQGPQHLADMEAQRREFEAWLHKENDKLTGILNNQRSLSDKELRIRQNTLKGLHAGVAWGQSQFQKLMAGRRSTSAEEDVELEELRYRWMLYKSKLKEAGDLRGLLKHKVQRENLGLGFLYRVCRVALPLQLLLLALLLLAFLLPMMDEGTSCSLSNNFARSFNIMLRYDGPPPT
uniref:Nesprin-3-like n=1 Tax=Sinocyclocheilus rhinocerous TaxID=307959 RepID=A0A673ML77_9TELE